MLHDTYLLTLAARSETANVLRDSRTALTKDVSSVIKDTKPEVLALIPLGLKFRTKNWPKLLRSVMPPPFLPFQMALVARRQKAQMRSPGLCSAPPKWTMQL